MSAQSGHRIGTHVVKTELQVAVSGRRPVRYFPKYPSRNDQASRTQAAVSVGGDDRGSRVAWRELDEFVEEITEARNGENAKRSGGGDRLSSLAQVSEGDPPGEPNANPAWMAPRPPGISTTPRRSAPRGSAVYGIDPGVRLKTDLLGATISAGPLTEPWRPRPLLAEGRIPAPRA
jgi:hypothetical protein